MPTSTKVIWTLAFIWQILHTAYFGWNLTAQSGAERVCDSITICAVMTGLAIWIGVLSDRVRTLEDRTP